ncbi:hypothetical protein CH330_08730 [candidate division WOR-3 bacterium JGI_Cruoil_03_51_56]|uniref:Gingipain propeptide domain-containing protein n=1 Tax=candidate division WOR-3 bacterium JGI_Cruoil_03_51_56 TaxID=1973747 RepID=A0A235BQA4_UNCW3|nr:MAG: hypothetical protein CH330_08730 [candidate division WOR-3 bacterium JGI_Cruoil_03_51_56]
MLRNFLKAVCYVFVAAMPLCAGGLTTNFDLEDAELIFSKSGEYDLVALDGAGLMTDTGLPALPQLSVNVVIPLDRKVIELVAEPLMTESVEGSFLIMPAQPPRHGDEQFNPDFVQPDPTVYSSHSWFPAEIAIVTGQSSMFGYNIAHLLITPLQYIPAEGKLRFHRKVTLTLTLEPSELDYLPVGKRTEETKHEIEEDLRSLVINPEDVSKFAPRND